MRKIIRSLFKAVPRLGDSKRESEKDDDFFDMSWPTGDIKKQFLYVFLIGITGPLWLTLPDVRREGKDRWVPVTFIGSILWIGCFR